MPNQHVYAVILAGGSGTRFWPVSRKNKPKQYLEIFQKNTLFDLTISRIKACIPAKNILIVTNERYKKETVQQVKKFKIPSKNVLLEPSAKNTAPAICWAAARLHMFDPEAVMVCLPSDHLILNRIKFVNTVKKAVSLAQKGRLVTFGIVPTRAETGYGYLQTEVKKVAGSDILVVKKFTEKPSKEKALRFLKGKSYFWNSGMFVWQAKTILNEFKNLLPRVYSVIGENPTYPHILKNWKKLPKVSIDYGIMEKSKNVAAVKAKDLGWSDVGSWESLIETLNQDKNGNVFLTDVESIDVKDSLAYGAGRKIALIGIRSCIVVDTPDALLVCKKKDSQKVKELVENLIKKKSKLI